jgi:hypothetical protein
VTVHKVEEIHLDGAQALVLGSIKETRLKSDNTSCFLWFLSVQYHK